MKEKPIFFSSNVKNCSKAAYELHYGKDREQALARKFHGLLVKYEERLAAATDATIRRDLERKVWYYKGLVIGKHDWYALKEVFEQHIKLDMVPNDYFQPGLWKCCCTPLFERKLADMLGTDMQ